MRKTIATVLSKKVCDELEFPPECYVDGAMACITVRPMSDGEMLVKMTFVKNESPGIDNA